MNKYKTISRKLKRQRLKARGCLDKVAFPTREAACQQGQDVYRCRYGNHWHRTGAVATIANTLAKQRVKE